MVNVFNISPRYPFLDVLARYVIETAKEQNLNIANDLILLPTRRACRHLKEIFLLLSENKATLIPTILPLGDIDENGFAFLDYDTINLDENLPKPITTIERNLILSKLVKQKMSDISEEQAYSLAVDLAHLMDTVEMEELSFDNLKNIVPDKYSKHWQETLEFLKIITENYPLILKEQNLLNPVDYKVKLIKQQINLWKSFPPKGRIFAAGSTGSLVPISYMLKYIASIDNGYLILPGLDKNISDSDFDFLTSDYPNSNQNHPQYGLLKLIKGLNLKINEVPNLPLYKKDYDVVDVDREKLSSCIMISSDMNSNWQNLSFKENVLENVTEIELQNEADEVFAISSLLRKSIEENKKALLITPDRKIAKSVASKLKSWNIIVDDSAGIPASDTITGNYIILILKMIYDNFSPYSLLAVLKHKYTHLGYNKNELNNIINSLENNVLCGKFGIDNLDRMLSYEQCPIDVEILLNKIKALCSEYISLMSDIDKYSIYDLFIKHLKLVENFVSGPNIDFNEILWSSDIHIELSKELKSFIAALKEIKNKEYSISIDEMTASAYFIFISNYLLSLNLRITNGIHPNIAIMNSIEARLIDADLYIMAGLNEDTFPAVISDDPWMNRPMKAEFKLPLPERKIGLSSHDFVEFFCKKNVVMTHSQKVKGVNTITSRWLTKLSAIVEIAKIKWDNSLSQEVLYWIKNFETKVIGNRCKQPSPCPPIEARPKELSATWIEKWYRDPYIIFANKILGLEKIKDINPTIGGAEFGDIIHNAVQKFKECNFSTEEELLNLMVKESLSIMSINQNDFWLQRFKSIAKSFIQFEKKYKNDVKLSILENEGKYKISDNFTIKAKADRIDVLNNNTCAVYDYKTGTIPYKKSVLTGYSPQLLIEALIIENGGYVSIGSKKVSKIAYLALKNKESDNKEIIFSEYDDKPLSEMIADTNNNLKDMINKFYNKENPASYISHPNPNKVGDLIKKYSEYEHLARIKEWNE